MKSVNDMFEKPFKSIVVFRLLCVIWLPLLCLALLLLNDSMTSGSSMKLPRSDFDNCLAILSYRVICHCRL